MKIKRILIVIILIAAPYFTFADSSNKTTYNHSEPELGTAYFLNLKYGYPSYSIYYHSPRFLFGDTVRFKIDYDAFRITEYIIGEYNRLSLLLDYHVPLSSYKIKHGLLLKAGIAVIKDLTDLNFTTGGLYINLKAGIDYRAQIKNYHFYGNSTFSFFRDGVWLETEIGNAYRLLSFLEIHFAFKPIFAFTFNGKASIGTYIKMYLNFIL
ncbi:MAG: hypothetical protein KAS64_03325 [Spirochaetes bacterium]|nr:hypothetical protein [Spirochaetota bacterium]